LEDGTRVKSKGMVSFIARALSIKENGKMISLMGLDIGSVFLTVISKRYLW
jgi:hypothetical protein